MRILHLISDLSGGGAEKQLSYLAPKLVSMGHKVHIAYSKEGPQKPDLLGVELYQLQSRSNYDPYLFWQIYWLVRCIKPDIIHTWVLQMDILGAIVARINKIVWIIREPASALAYQKTWKCSLRVHICSWANAIVSNSKNGDEYWKTHLSHKPRYVIANALPLEKINSTSTKLPPEFLKTNVPLVLYVGRLEEGQKKPKAFLEVLAIVKKKLPIQGIICGEGPNRSELEIMTHRLGLDSEVYFAGYLAETVVWTLMKKAALFVSLSAYEGCPNTVMEAMACGCPLVLSDIPEHREILDENCAFFVDSSNIQQTAEVIISVLNNPEGSKQRILNAKQKTEAWSIDTMSKHYERIYKEVL